jgi:pilus assembly protein CpaE
MESADRQLAAVVRNAGLTAGSVSAMGDFSMLDRHDAVEPDVLLLDLRGERRLPSELGGFKRRHPKTGVVIVASQLDPSLMLEAMRAGVTEWVTDPLTADDLKAAIQRVVSQLSVARAPSRVFAFVGAKGGVGTTVAAANVAAALAAEPNSQVLMADMHVDSYGDAGLLFGVEPKFTVVDALDNVHRLDQAFLGTLVIRAKPGLDLLASAERPSLHPPDGKKVRDLIERLAANYATVVLDMGRADLGTIVLRQRLGKDRLAVVISRYDAGMDIGQDDIERVVGLPVWGAFPNDYRLVTSSANDGRPFALDSKAKLPAAVRQFAKRLTGSRAPERPAATKAMSRLAGLF